MEYAQAIVIDNGTGYTKAGFAGDDAPRSLFPSVVGRLRLNGMPYAQIKSVYFGDEAIERRGILTLSSIKPSDWDGMDELLRHIYSNELNVVPEEHPVLMTEAPHSHKSQRERTTQLMFESFNVPAFYLAITAVLTSLSYGRTDALVLECGDGLTHFVPVHEGHALLNSSMDLYFNGSNLTEYLSTLLKAKGLSNIASEKDIVRSIKEKLGYVALDYEDELRSPLSSLENTYKLPDGQVVTLGNERFQCPEAYFKPSSLYGIDAYGVDMMTYQSINRCDETLHTIMYSNIALGGGSSLFTGLKERLQKELTNLAPKDMEVKVHASPERKYSAWIGGSIFASLNTFNQQVITSRDYDEYGPTIVHQKCF